MKITDVISVLLICQHLASVYGDLPLFPPNIYPFSLPQQPFNPNLEQRTLSLQRADQPFLPLQQLNPPLRQFPPFQHTELPPKLTFQLQQQFQRPQQQLYRTYQQPDPLLQQSRQYFNQPIVCPQGTPTCPEGLIATCTRHAVTGSLAYYCLRPISRTMASWTPSDTNEINPSSSMNTTLNDLNPVDSKTGARSLLGTDTVLEPLSDNTNLEPLGVNVDSDVGKQGANPPMPTGPYYPCDCRLCLMCSLMMMPFSRFSTCNQGQLGYPNVSNCRLPPLSQPGYIQPETFSNLYSTMLPFTRSPAMFKPEKVAYPFQSPTGFPPEPHNRPGFLLPSYYQLGQLSYQSGQIFANQQPLSSYSPPSSRWLVNNEPKPQDYQQQFAPPSYSYNGWNQPIRTAPETYQNPQPFSGEMQHYSEYQQVAPSEPLKNPLIFPDTESRQQERILESPQNQPPLTMSLVAYNELPQKNFPTLQGRQPVVAPHNPRQKPLFAKAQGNLVYQSPGLHAPMMVRRVQDSLQPRYQNINQLPQQFQPSPLDLSISQNHPRDMEQTPDTAKKYENTMQRKKSFPETGIRKKSQPKPQPYLTSGLSLLSEPEEPSLQEKPIMTDDKFLTSKKHVKKEVVQKQNVGRQKPSSSNSSWI